MVGTLPMYAQSFHQWSLADNIFTQKSLEAYLTRETTMNAIAGAFSPAILQAVTPVISSIGDLQRLNLLNAYLPSAKNPTLTINDLVFAIRVRLPVIIALIQVNVCANASILNVVKYGVFCSFLVSEKEC